MAEKVGSVYIEIQAKMGSLEKDLIRLEEKLNGVNRKGKETGSTLATMGKFLSAGVIAGGLYAVGKAALTASAQMEQNGVAFTTMLGSAEKASALLKEMTAFASTTPFELPEIVEGGKKLLAFGFAAKDIIPTLTKLGDVSAGLSIPIGELSQIYGKMKVAGVIQAEELNVLTERGIPIFSELAKVMKVNENQIKKMGSEGKITFSDLEKAFTNMTKEGSQFGGLMIAQANTLGGKWSNFQDNLGKAATILGNDMAPVAKDLLDIGTQLLSKFTSKDMPDSITMTGSIIKDVNALLNGTKDHIDKIVEAMGDTEADALYQNVVNTERTADGVSGHFEEILGYFDKTTGQYDSLNGAAAMYTAYTSGDIKLKQEQISKLERILALGKEMTGEAQSVNAVGVTLGDAYADVLTAAYEAKKKIDAAEKDTQTKRTSGFSKGKSEAQKFYEELVKIANATDEAGVLQKRLTDIDTYEKRLNESWIKNKIGTERYNKEIETITLARIKTEEEAEKRKYDSKMEAMNASVSFVSSLDTQLSQILQMNASNQTANVDIATTERLERLDEEYNAEVERINSLAITEEEKNAKLKALDEQKARDEKAIEDKAAKEKRKIARETAKQTKALALLDSIITTPQMAINAYNSAVKIPYVGWILAPAAAAAALAFGVAKTAMIAQQPLPALAEGGIVPAVPNGNKYTLGEGGSEEAVIPLNDQTLSRLASMINKAGNTSGQSPVLHVYINDDYKGLYNASKNGVVMIDKRAVV